MGLTRNQMQEQSTFIEKHWWAGTWSFLLLLLLSLTSYFFSLTLYLCVAFRTAYDTFRKDLDGILDLAALENTAHSLGINLTEEEVLDELMYADIDGKCTVIELI